MSHNIISNLATSNLGGFWPLEFVDKGVICCCRALPGMRGYGSGSAAPNPRSRNIAVTNNSTGVISALTGAPQSAKFKSASMANNSAGPSVGAYDPVLGN